MKTGDIVYHPDGFFGVVVDLLADAGVWIGWSDGEVELYCHSEAKQWRELNENR